MPPRPQGLAWLRVAARGLPILLILTAGLAIKLLLRGPEALLAGRRRPLTPWITVLVCRAVLPLLGLRVGVRGALFPAPGALTPNHSSWIDIFVLNALAPMVFVAKAEVAGWPGIGWLAQATGTLFIRRDGREAAAQLDLVRSRLALGQRLVIFPEGTSSDGLRVLPFRPTLFAALGEVWVQPVTLRYTAPPGQEARFWGWWGGMGFAPHALAVLAAPRGGRVDVLLHSPLPPGQNRKALSAAAEAAVRDGLARAGDLP